ncbi:hypothetical protein FQA39_LY16751 [Lamprigera yunnana]|nr:hypothetical protein FQA39_LY16751 [Lamprigera yunnana]
MNSAEAFVICPYNPKHKVLRKNLVKHKFKSHPVLYKKDLDACYKIKLDAQDAAGYAVNDDEMKRLDPISMENKKGSFENSRNSSTNEAIPKHIHQHNTPPQHLRLLQYGLKIPNHQTPHQHQPTSIPSQLHHHHRSQSPYQAHDVSTLNIYQNQILPHQSCQYQPKQDNQQNHFHYRPNQPPLSQSQNCHQQNAQIWIPHKQLVNFRPSHHQQLHHQPQMRKSETEATEYTSPTFSHLKSKENERRKVTNLNNRFPTAKRPLEAPVAMQGWLYKQGSDGLMLWRKRWFVLSEYCLFYYKGPDEEKILGSILLPSYRVSICRPDDKVNRKFAFKCEHINMRTYVLAADSQELMMQWVRVLNLASLLQNSNDADNRSQLSTPSQSVETSMGYQQNQTIRSTPIHMHTCSNTTEISNPSQQELNVFSQPLYANAPPKPRRLTDGYSSPSSEVADKVSIDSKYITLQRTQQYNMQPVYTSLNNSNSKSPINVYGNPQLYPEYISRSVQQQLYNKHLHIPEHQSVVMREHANVERRTPDTYGRSKSNQSKGVPLSDYEDIYADQTMYKRPLSPITYNNNNNKLNPVPAIRPYTPITMHGAKGHLAYVSHQPKIPNTIPRPHSADFLEYEIKHENPNTIVRKARPKSSLDINKHTNNDNDFYSEERYAEKMRKSAQYLPKMTKLTGHSEYIHNQKWHQGANNSDYNSSFSLKRCNSRLLNFNEVNRDFCQRGLQPVRSRSVLSDGSLSKEVDIEVHSNIHDHFEKECMSPVFGNQQELYDDNEEIGRSKEYDQFTRSASARLAQNNGQDQKLLNREGERKREESMKRLLEWKQRMLQSPLNRKVNQGVHKGYGTYNTCYRTSENGYPNSLDIYYETKSSTVIPQYSSYSSDDEENEDGSKENVQTQAGRTTDTYSSTSQSHTSALKAPTTVFHSFLKNDVVHSPFIDSSLPVVCTNLEKNLKDSKLFQSKNIDNLEKPLKIETNPSRHTALVSNLRFSGGLEKEANTTEITANGAFIKRILAEFEQNDDNIQIIKSNGALENIEDNYMTMTSKKSILEPSETSSLLSLILSTDVDENLYVEMTQGSDISVLKTSNGDGCINELQTYETISFGSSKMEPLYMELNQFNSKKEVRNFFKSDLPDILIASQNKSKTDNKSDSSDADDEASKDLDSLDTLYNPRFSLSDTFRPASYYLGVSRMAPELQDSSDSELVSPPPIPTSPPPMDDLDNMEESLDANITVQEVKEKLLRYKMPVSQEMTGNDPIVELHVGTSRASDRERILKRKPVSEEFYDEFSTDVNNFDLDKYLRDLEVSDISMLSKNSNGTNKDDKNGIIIHDYENMYVSNVSRSVGQRSNSTESLPPTTLHTHSRDNSRDTANSIITTSSQHSTFSPNDFVLRGRPNSITSILDDISGYISGSSYHLTPIAYSESSTTVTELNYNSFYFFDSKPKQFSLSQSAPYYYSDLSINTSRTDSSSSILTLNNQRSATTGTKRDITHIINPIRRNNYIGKSTSTLHQNLFATRCKLAAEARSASVDFLNIADKSGNIDKKNIYESDTLKRLKMTDSSDNLQDKSDVRNMYLGARSEKFTVNELNVRRSYSLEGLLENVLNESISVPQEFRDTEQNETIKITEEREANEMREGSHLWEEDSVCHEQLRSASQRHTRSLDDLDTIRELDRKSKKQSRGISRLVTYVNDNMFNMPIQNKHTRELEVKKEESNKNGLFIIDREKLRQWDFLSSAPSGAQSIAQSPIHGCTTNTVVDLSASVSACEASEQNNAHDSASGSISITARDTFPRVGPVKKMWIPSIQPIHSKSTTNLTSDYLKPQQGCYVSQAPSHHDLSSDTSQSSYSRWANWQLEDKMNVSAGELLGRTHEELVLLLIQLRRQSANNCNAIEACYNEIDNIQSRLPKMDSSKRLENLQKLEQIKQHLLELERQYEKGKPLVNLVDNMVKLGSLYRLPKDNNHHPHTKDRLVFNQHIQECRLLAEERRDWNRLSPNQTELQTKVQQLFQLDHLIQEESETLQSLQQDKEEIEKTLGGLRHRLIQGFKDPMEVEQAKKQQVMLENELIRVHYMLSQNSRKLEETVAGNARLEQELLVLKQKSQLSKQQRSSPQISNTGDSLPCVIGTSAMLESDLHRVQQKVGDLQRQRLELSALVRQLTDRSNSLQQLRLSSISTQAGQGNKKKINALWRETDLDTMKFIDHGELGDTLTNEITPLYINTNIKHNVESDFSISDFKSNGSASDDNQNSVPQEKQEIKTVRIVKRESERRQRDREKITSGRWDVVTEEEEDSSPTSRILFGSMSKTESTIALDDVVPNNLDNNKSSVILSRQNSTSHSSLPQLYSDIRTALNLSSEKISELSPIFTSESAKQIIMEMTAHDMLKHTNRRIVPKEKRRHYTAPHNNLIIKSLNRLPTDNKDFDKLDTRRARDDLDMERALRQRIDAPDVVRSTLSNKELKYNENTIDNILGTPNKIIIPERYIPEQLPQLTAEEQQYRLRKVESIKKMLSDTTIISGSSPNLASEEASSENPFSSTSNKLIEEKKQREHLLQLNQILAKQVMEMSKIVAGII